MRSGFTRPQLIDYELRIPMRGYEVTNTSAAVASISVTNPHEGL